MIEQGAKHVYVLDMADTPSPDFNDSAKLAEAFGGKLTYHQVNVTDPEAVDRIFVEIEKEHNRLDVLFAAAGILGTSRPRLERVRGAGPELTVCDCFLSLSRVAGGTWMRGLPT